MSTKLSLEELLVLKNLLEEDALEGSQLSEVGRTALKSLLSITRAYDVQYSIVEQKDKISGSTLIISKFEISNIKCFKQLTIESIPHLQNILYLMLLGDNAIGKSTILKSIALGLCNESDAAVLIKASETQGDFIRQGETEGYIKIHLCRDSKAKRPKKYTITTKITRKSADAPEIVRQETQPAENFPWADIFVCGYGAYRSKQADTSYEQYKAIDAVKSLFDHQTSLQNPELIALRYLRKTPQIHSILEEKLLNILMLDPQTHAIHFTTRGLEIDGPWGRMPLQNLSDGYRSTTIWVLDFIGWLLHAERLLGNPDIGGILIIDEIEQHLHPRWQRYIVQRLRQQFPKTQIIASTHTPLVAAGIADVDQSMLLKLERNEENEISLKIIDKEQVAGKRADQVLTSDAFGLYTTRNERSHDDVDRYTKLLGKKIRNEAEEAELEELRSQVSSRFSTGETHFEQLVEKAVDEVLKNMDTPVSPEMLNLETKKQLQSLFHPNCSDLAMVRQ
jgi:predicted ATP-binding protein involved in virulence